jgi:hypothetical protein
MSTVTDLQAIRNSVNKASLSETVLTRAHWYLDKLPDLYSDLEKTDESRFLDEIARHLRAMLMSIDSPTAVDAIVIELHAMHERHGIPKLNLRLPVAAAKKTRTPKSKVGATRAAST